MPAEIITKSSADVIVDVFRTFGDESGTQVTESDIIRWINRFQLELVMRNPEVGAAVAMTNVVSGQADYPLLASVPTVLTVQSVHYNNLPIKNLSFQEAETFLITEDNAGEQGTPQFWYERGGIITLFPAPDTAITNGLKFYFNKRPADITTNSQLLSVADHYYNTLISFVLEQAYLLDENVQMAGAAAQKFEAGIQQMKERTSTQSDYYPVIGSIEEY